MDFERERYIRSHVYEQTALPSHMAIELISEIDRLRDVIGGDPKEKLQIVGFIVENENLRADIERLRVIISKVAKHIHCYQQADNYIVDIMHIANYCERCWSKDGCEHSNARKEI